MESNKIEQMVASFRNAVLEVAAKEKEQATALLVQQGKELTAAAEQKAQGDARARVEKETDAIKRDVNRQLVDKKFEAKKELLRRRMEIQDEVFAAVREKLISFTDSEEYLANIKADIKETKVYKLSEDIGIFLPAADKGERAVIEQYYPKAEYKTDESIGIGGFRMEDQKRQVILDYTLDKAMAEAGEKFLDISGLSAQI